MQMVDTFVLTGQNEHVRKFIVMTRSIALAVLLIVQDCVLIHWYTHLDSTHLNWNLEC